MENAKTHDGWIKTKSDTKQIHHQQCFSWNPLKKKFSSFMHYALKLC